MNLPKIAGEQRWKEKIFARLNLWRPIRFRDQGGNIFGEDEACSLARGAVRTPRPTRVRPFEDSKREAYSEILSP